MRAADAARAAGVITGVGYNYRFAPLVQYARAAARRRTARRGSRLPWAVLLDVREDPLGRPQLAVSRRTRAATASRATCSATQSTSRTCSSGPIARVVGDRATIRSRSARCRRPAARTTGAAAPATRRARSRTRTTSRCSSSSRAARAARSSLRARSSAPRARWRSTSTARGALWAGTSNGINELQLYLSADEPHTGYTTVFGGDRFPHHGAFVPGSANGIGFEDLVAIEDFEFLQAVARGSRTSPGSRTRCATSRCRRRSSARGLPAAGRRSPAWPRWPREDRPADHGAGHCPLPRRAAHAARWRGGAAVPWRLRNLRPRQRARSRQRPLRGSRRPAHVPRPERAGHGAGRDGIREGDPPAPDHGGDVLDRAGRPEHGHGRRVAHANRLPLLLLAGDTFQSRIPGSRPAAGGALRLAFHHRQRRLPARDPLLGPDHAAGAGRAVAAARRRDDARSGRLRPGLHRPAPGRAGRGVRLSRRRSSGHACTSRAGRGRTGARSRPPPPRSAPRAARC